MAAIAVIFFETRTASTSWGQNFFGDKNFHPDSNSKSQKKKAKGKTAKSWKLSWNSDPWPVSTIHVIPKKTPRPHNVRRSIGMARSRSRSRDRRRSPSRRRLRSSNPQVEVKSSQMKIMNLQKLFKYSLWLCWRLGSCACTHVKHLHKWISNETSYGHVMLLKVKSSSRFTINNQIFHLHRWNHWFPRKNGEPKNPTVWVSALGVVRPPGDGGGDLRLPRGRWWGDWKSPYVEYMCIYIWYMYIIYYIIYIYICIFNIWWFSISITCFDILGDLKKNACLMARFARYW